MATLVNQRRRYRGRTRSTMQSAVRHLTNLVTASNLAGNRCVPLLPADRRNVSPPGLLVNVDVFALNAAILVLKRCLQTVGPAPTCLSV